MISYMSSRQLKASAKARLTPVFSIVAGATAIYYGFSFFLNISVSTVPVLPDSFWVNFLIILLQYFIAFFAGILGAGYQYLFLKLYCGRPISSGDVFYAFKQQLRTAATLSAIMATISVLSMIPFTVFSCIYAVTLDNMDLAGAFFCLTPAVILTTLADLIYSQIYYLMLDFPSFTAKELFRRSRLLMRGHKGRLFYIIVSFIPLYLLGILTCGIGLLWVLPYIQAVKTEFYLDLVSKKQYCSGQKP